MCAGHEGALLCSGVRISHAVPRLTLWVVLPMEGCVGMPDERRRRVLLCEGQCKYRRTTAWISDADVAQLVLGSILGVGTATG